MKAQIKAVTLYKQKHSLSPISNSPKISSSEANCVVTLIPTPILCTQFRSGKAIGHG